MSRQKQKQTSRLALTTAGILTLTWKLCKQHPTQVATLSAGSRSSEAHCLQQGRGAMGGAQHGPRRAGRGDKADAALPRLGGARRQRDCEGAHRR
jgi:hypothetical protein